jgi:ubiquitin-protein ligase
MQQDISFCISDYLFNLKKNSDYYIIISNNTDTFDWIDAINMYSINKKPSKDKLIEKIKTKLKNLNILQNLDINVNQSVNTNGLETKEMKIYKELERIKKLNNFTENDNINISGAKKLFNNSTIKDILTNEYIKIWEHNSDKISINIDNNIYDWTIRFVNNKIGNILMKITFNQTYFPYAPPQICFISPKLLDKLDYRISNCKIFKLNYWNPITNIGDIIDKISTILDKYALNDSFNNEKKINQNLYQKLLLLSSYITNEENDELDEYFKMYYRTQNNNTNIDETLPKKKNKKVSDKFNGTGYRSGEDNNWKIEDYENLQKTKEYELISILTGINNDIDKINKNELYNTLENSLLIKFLSESLNNTTLLEMSKKFDLYKLCFNIIQNICIDTLIPLLFDTKYNLFNSIKKLYDLCNISAKIDKSDSNEIISNVMFLWSMYSPLQEMFNNITNKNIEKIIENKSDKSDKFDKSDKSDKSDNYVNDMIKLRFDTSNIITSNYNKTYLSQLKSTKTSNNCMKRLSTEIPTLASELPIHQDASIFLRVDENNPRAMRALITGPPDTPYDSGIFIFDIYIPPNYPNDVPMVNFTNTGNKRFNPNLYNCGKVCLSILGTYVGPTASQTEKWNSSSTLYQVLISIQAQILVEKPYFNEPGYQNFYGTSEGEKKSEDYNKNIKLYTMQYAMYDLLNNNNFPEFKDIIDNHFKLKKNKIIDICTKWIQKSNNDVNYKNIGEKIINKLNNL